MSDAISAEDLDLHLHVERVKEGVRVEFPVNGERVSFVLSTEAAEDLGDALYVAAIS